MRKANTGMAMGQTKEKVEDCLTSENLRRSSNAFTREGKLGAKRILHLILGGIYRALQLCLDDYFESFGELSVSKQAFSKARKNLKPEYIREFFEITSSTAATDDTLDTYRGMRLIAVDGSDVALENTAELKKAFGCSGPKKNAATALCSIAYGPLDHVIYDCQIDRYEKDERDLAKLHMEKLCGLGLGGSLLLFDRWYPSASFIASVYESGFHFVMRVRAKWNIEADAVKGQKWISVSHAGHDYAVRVLKVILSTGEVETLLTSLNQKQLPIRNAGDLYFKRWGVETAFDLIKSKLQLENFSGKTEVSVKQDFFATMYLANLAAFVAGAADEQIAASDEGKGLLYQRQANRNRSIYKLRHHFLRILLEPDPVLRDAALSRIVDSLADKPVPIVPGRSPLRKAPRSKRFHIAKKSVL